MAAPPSINPAAVANLVKLVIGGTAAAWGVNNSLFNVEGGHRAIVFNRLVGIKETVRRGWGVGRRAARRQRGALREARRCCCARRQAAPPQADSRSVRGGCVPHLPHQPPRQCAFQRLLTAGRACAALCPPPPPPQVYQEGTHLMVPWIDRPVIYDVRARPSLISSTSGSRDLQMVRGGCWGHAGVGGCAALGSLLAVAASSSRHAAGRS